MKESKYIWIAGLVVTLILILVPVVIFLPRDTKPQNDPWANLPTHPTHTDHTHLMTGPFETGSEVTRACLECHPDAASQVMATTHWTWESKPYDVPGRDEPVTVGKKNQLNNFCLGIQSNWPG
jgi:hypothetical protein